MMVIGLCRGRVPGKGALAAGLLFLLAVPGMADDQIQLKSGSSVTGQITGVSDGQVSVASRSPSGSPVRLSYYLTDIQSVTMEPPAAVTQLKDAAPAQVIATLAPLVAQYAGLPADWVVDAMGQLADAYDSSGQSDKAQAVYAQINQLYPHSRFQSASVAGLAKLDLQQGKVDDALAALQPLVDKADQDLAPSATEGRSFARVFLIYGQALEKKQQYAQALEAYLTVKTMFYQNPALVAEAEQDAAHLRQQNPGVRVD